MAIFMAALIQHSLEKGVPFFCVRLTDPLSLFLFCGSSSYLLIPKISIGFENILRFRISTFSVPNKLRSLVTETLQFSWSVFSIGRAPMPLPGR